jgi:predicted small metal-binding protein
MGGKCDAKIEAETSAEMMDKMTAHVTENHPDIAEKMKNMDEKERGKWQAEFQRNWSQAKEK